MVFIDYSYMSYGLKNVLNILKFISKKQQGWLLVLFGCGGNRDSGRFAKVGKIVSDFADFLVMSEDNPRMEDSQTITDEILSGVNSSFQDYELIQNRSKAIEFIINQSQENDVVLLTGKGYKTYQVFKTETIHIDDREQAVQAKSDKLILNLKAFQPDLCISLPGLINV